MVWSILYVRIQNNVVLNVVLSLQRPSVSTGPARPPEVPGGSS